MIVHATPKLLALFGDSVRKMMRQNYLTLQVDAPIFAHVETNRNKIVRRLERDGWLNRGGGSHDVFTHPSRPGVIIVVPRHRELSPGVYRQIAKQADWR
jgi:predicted RNA binding protein YcfA (HicA-like mRNA interferase family)